MHTVALSDVECHHAVEEGIAARPCRELLWLNFLEVFPRVLGFALGILPVLVAIGGLIGGIHVWVDRDDRRYVLRLREESRLRQQQLDDESSARDRATRRVREAS